MLAEAHFFGLWELVDVLEPLALEEAVQLEADPPIRRNELVSPRLAWGLMSMLIILQARLLLSTSGRHGDLRCQGLNFTGSDLSRVCYDVGLSRRVRHDGVEKPVGVSD